MRKKFLFIIISVVLCNILYSQGTTTEHSIYSSNLKRTVYFNVYLPPSYGQSEYTYYPVLYLFHGKGGKYYDWENNANASETLNSKIAEGVKEMVVVMPDGLDSWYIDGSMQWESYMYEELIPAIQDSFRVATVKKHRAIAGLSMGGWGNSYHWIKHGAELYSSAYCMSGALGVREGIDLKEYINELTTEELAALPPYAMECGTEDHLYDLNVDWNNFLVSKGIEVPFIERSGAHEWSFWTACLPNVIDHASNNFGENINIYVGGTFNSWTPVFMKFDNDNNRIATTANITAGEHEITFADTSDFSGKVWGNATGLSNTAQLVANGDPNITFTVVETGIYTINFNTETLEYSIVKNTVVTGVSVSPTSVYLLIEEEQQLTATVSPSDATYKDIIWSSSNTEVATVKNGLVSAIATGSADITVETVDGGFTATCTITVEDEQATSSGEIINNKNDQTFSVFPNPANDYIILDLSEHKKFFANYTIYNEIGELVKTGTLADRGNKKLDISGLKSGIYLIKLLADKIEYNCKFMVK